MTYLIMDTTLWQTPTIVTTVEAETEGLALKAFYSEIGPPLMPDIEAWPVSRIEGRTLAPRA